MTEEILNKIKHFVSNNQFIEAEELIEKSKNINNNLLLYFSGFVKHKLNKNKEAIKYLKKIKEKVPEVFFLMGNIKESLFKLDDALNYFNKAIKIKDSYWQAHFNKGLIFIKKKEFEEAKKSLKKVLEIDQNNYNAEYFLGLLSASHDFKIAEKHYRKAISLYPDHEKAHGELGKILLFYGNLKEGWDEYQWRSNYLEKIYPKNIRDVLLWDGKNSMKHKLLVLREQGLGDEILFSSCYNEIIEKTKKCFFISDSRLVNLFKNSFPKGEFLSEDIFSKNTDLSKILPTARIQNCNIPKFLRKSFNDFPNKRNYLKPDKKKYEIWKKKLLNDSKGKLKIGLAWNSSSSDDFESKKNVNKSKTLDAPIEFRLNEWEHFLCIDNIFLVNLMYKNVNKEINDFQTNNKKKIVTYKNLDIKNDIDNVAALLANLDIVISAQTWVGDFASALGTEVLKFHNIFSITRLGQKNIPWNNSTIFDRNNGSWKDSFKLIKSLLNKRMVK